MSRPTLETEGPAYRYVGPVPGPRTALVTPCRAVTPDLSELVGGAVEVALRFGCCLELGHNGEHRAVLVWSDR